MVRRKRSAQSNRIFLKISSLLLGAFFWYVWSGIYPLTRNVSVPLSFYNIPDGAVVTSPEELTVQLRGTRQAFLALDAETLAMYIDAHRFAEGPNNVTVGADSLFLPESVRLVDYTPSNIVALMGHEEQQESTKQSNVQA